MGRRAPGQGLWAGSSGRALGGDGRESGSPGEGRWGHGRSPVDRPRSGHQRPGTHLPGGPALVGASLVGRTDGDLRTEPDTTHGVLGKGSRRGRAWARGRSGEDALQGRCARKRPLPGRCRHCAALVARGRHGGPGRGCSSVPCRLPASTPAGHCRPRSQPPPRCRGQAPPPRGSPPSHPRAHHCPQPP